MVGAAKADEVRLRELCNELLGPARSGGASAGGPDSSAADVDSTEQWSPEVCHPLTQRLNFEGTHALV